MFKLHKSPGPLLCLSFILTLAPSISLAAAEKCAGDLFDADAYLARYKDLRDAGLKKKNACKHYKIIGKLEGRSGALETELPSTGLPACKAGPEIKVISGISSTGLSVQFHGEEVYGIDYSILNGVGSSVASGSFAPTNNTPQISYSALSGGNYTLVFKGNKCEGGSQKAFVVPGAPAATLPSCKAGPEIQVISSITSTALTAQFHGEEIYGIDYEVLNSSKASVASGSFIPTSNSPKISYSALATGNYTLVFKGNKCEGGSQKAFLISSGSVIVPPVANLPTCKAGPTILQVSNISSTGLTAQFHGEEIYGIDYSVLSSSGVKVASGSFVPASSTPAVTFSSLAEGSYTLVFSANKCIGESSKDFKIVASSTTGGTTGGSSGSYPAELSSREAGLFEVTSNGKTFRWVDGLNVRLQVNTNGTVNLNYPKTRRSGSGSRDTVPWLFNSYMVPLKASDIEALSGSGLTLPEGNHTFYVYYFDPIKAPDVSALRNNWWEVIMNPDTFQTYTSGAEYVVLEVRDANAPSSNEIKVPSEVRGVSWYPQYQETSVNLSLPAGKVYGITKRVDGVTAQRLVEQGQSIQTAFWDVNGILPWDKTWSTLRSASHKGEGRVAYDGTIAAGQKITLEASGLNIQTDNILSMHKGVDGANGNLNVDFSIPENGKIRFVISNYGTSAVTLTGSVYAKYFGNIEEKAQELYNFGARPGNITGSEICENGIPGEYTEKIFRRIFEIQKERDGITSVVQSNIIGDYFQALFGYGTDLNRDISFNDKRQIMSSSSEAQKGRLKDDNGNTAAPSYYYTNKAYEYRHRLAGAYLDGIGPLLEGNRLYNHINNLEKQYIAKADRKVTSFGWTGFEGITAKTDVATWQRLPLKNGDLIRLSRMEGSYEQLKYEVFYSLLVGDNYVSWNDNAFMGKDINNFGLAHIGDAADWKNLWQPTGGDVVQYNPNNPSHPKAVDSGKGGWSDGAAPGHNGGFAGAYLMSQVKNRVNQSLRYPVYSYTVNGKNYTGYFNGNDPVRGSQGAEVSRFGMSNVGQHNIVNQHEYRKPIVFFGQGSEGRVLIVLNPSAGLNETTTYNVSEGGSYTVGHVGPHLGIYKL